MTSPNIEKRLSDLEAQMKRLVEGGSAGSKPATNKEWLFKIWGSFANDPAFKEAMRHGRKWRESQRPRTDKTTRSRRGR